MKAKAVFEIIAPKSGYFYTNLNEGDIPDVGDVIDTYQEEVADIFIEKSNKKEDPKNTENNISKPALEYIEENSIDLNKIKDFLPTEGLVTKALLKLLVNQLVKTL